MFSQNIGCSKVSKNDNLCIILALLTMYSSSLGCRMVVLTLTLVITIVMSLRAAVSHSTITSLELLPLYIIPGNGATTCKYN